MSKVNLAGLDIVIRDFGKTIKISKEDFTSKFVDKKAYIKIEILDEEGKVINGMSSENLIRGLIVCSNYFLPESEPAEEVKKYKCCLDKCIKRGAVITIEMFDEENKQMHLAISINGHNKFNFYGLTLMEILKNVEEFKKIAKSL